MKIKIKTNALAYIALLKKQHGGLAIAGSRTVNDAAEMVEKQYRKNLQSFILRNKFTEGAIKLLKSNPVRSTGSFRKIENIKAIVGVRKMKGGKDHYLKKQEEGGTTSGNPRTLGSVAIPLNAARASESKSKPIKGALQLQKSGAIQTLKVGGKPIGVSGSEFTPRQSWAMLYKYSGSGKGRAGKGGMYQGLFGYGWDMSKQFFFNTIKGAASVFTMKGRRFSRVRNLEQKSVHIKQTGKFKRAVSIIDHSVLESIFIKVASRVVQKK